VRLPSSPGFEQPKRMGTQLKKYLLILLLALMAGCTKGDGFNLSDVLRARPDQDKVIFDYVGLLQGVQTSTSAHLKTIRDRYQIEILMAVLPSLADQYTVNQAATELFSNWKIGKNFQSRGILLLLVDDVKEVKLEVGFELEELFTDMFTGQIETVQLQPRYSAGALEIGLIAVLEALEARAQMQYKGGYTRAQIADLDAAYLSQGAGARLGLDGHPAQVKFSGPVNRTYPAGETPEAAWHTMIQRWRDKVRDPYLAIFTSLARLSYRDFANMPDAHFEKEYRTYADKGYQILEKGDYAVVYFGKKTGWDNAPFLLCRTAEGWQFDLVHQRRFIRMGTAPHWGVEFSEHPHMDLLMDSFQFQGQDIPLEGEDLYTIEQDSKLAGRILTQEAAYQANPNDFDTAMTLGRLYAIVSMGNKAIKVLQKAQKLDPDDARPFKYLAIAHVDAHYQYDAALKALETYLARKPLDPFAHNFSGYLLFRQKVYAKAADAFEKALELNPDNCYAHFYLAYIYVWRYDQALKLDPRRKDYKTRFNHHVTRTRSYQTRHPIRVAKLNNWLAQ
jgi:tetratricopeptide (TPR) repeat protein